MQHDDWAERRDPLLDRVYARGQELRRRRQMAMGFIAAAIVILIAVPAVALSGSGGSHSKVDTIGAPTTQSSEDTTTAPVAGVVTPASDAPTTTAARPTPTTARAGTTTTTALVCRNSTNPACGPFYWDPAPPPNQPLTVQVTYSPANPRPGETVHFYPVADDPDATFIESVQCASAFGDETTTLPCEVHPSQYSVDPPMPYGPWSPPAPEHGHCPGGDPHEECQFFFPPNSSRDASGACSIDYTYNAPGTYTAKLTFHSFGRVRFSTVQGLPDPYANDFTASVTVKVSGTPVTTTTMGPGNYSQDC